MRKELTPGLFGNHLKEGFREGFVESVPDTSSVELSALHSASEQKRLEKRFEQNQHDSKLKTEELSKSVQSRFDIVAQKLHQMESRFEALSQDFQSRYSNLSSKMTERNLTDMKTQALIDRHTQIMRQFEQRIVQLQKVIEEQEFQLMNYKATLDDARKEIARLKRL